MNEALLPAPDHRLGLPRTAHNLRRVAALGVARDDPGAPDILLRRAAIGDDGLTPRAVVPGDSRQCPALMPRA
jgi:hypothetical protein